MDTGTPPFVGGIQPSGRSGGNRDDCSSNTLDQVSVGKVIGIHLLTNEGREVRNMKKNAGFTLIELVVVITILAILSAVALPRYIAAQRDARIAKIQGIYGAIRAASGLAKARCELDLGQGLSAAGTCGAAAPQVNMDGTLVDIVNRYPAATATGIDAAAQVDATNDGLTIAGNAPRTFDVSGATAPTTCRISYTAAVANGSPTITLVSTGC